MSIIPIKKSEFNFIKRIFWFIVGLLNIIPSEANIYEAILLHITTEITSASIWYSEMIFLMKIFKVAIIIGTVYALYEIFRYGIRYNVFGLEDVVDEIEDQLKSIFGG